MTLLGLDLNATCARAVRGPVGGYPLGLALDPPEQTLPMVLSLEKHKPEVGRAGLRLLRHQPHLTCSNFLVHLGTNGTTSRRWQAGRHHFDSNQALAVVLQQLGLAFQNSAGVALSLPAYLSRGQAELIRQVGAKQRLPLLGSLPSLLAAALAGYAEQAWIGSVLVVDIDEQALSVGLVRAVESQAHLLETRHFPKLGLKVWKDRLINALADSCILQSRRDPRDVSLAEQALFEQLDAVMDACLQGRMIQLAIQASQWYQNLLVQPEQTTVFCGHLARQVAHAAEALCQSLPSEDAPASILLTAQVARLPGLVQLLRSYMESVAREPARSNPRPPSEDFGDELIQDSSGQIVSVAVLAPEGLARAAHGIGSLFRRGALRGGHLDTVAPLPLPQTVEAGPPRLHFQGQDYFLTDPNFLLGSQIGCHLLFDSARFPVVAARHCEILFDHRTYLLHNRSRAGTLVNDAQVAGSTMLHPGDWIRLGPGGPLVRFLGTPLAA